MKSIVVNDFSKENMHYLNKLNLEGMGLNNVQFQLSDEHVMHIDGGERFR